MPVISAYSEALRVFRGRKPEEMAVNSGAEFDEKGNRFHLTYFGHDVDVDYPSGQIRCNILPELNVNDRVLILQYLFSSCGTPPRDSWLSFIQLPDGPHHHAPFVVEAITPLAAEFGGRPGELMEQAAVFGAEKIMMGDYGVRVPAFSHLPLAVCIWEGDEEFPANANILFDVTAPLHLTTAALWVLGVELSRKLRGITGQQYS
ncbi:MAG: hypothetical protein CVU89_07645 [Firmicutes bacterium HGW-Firmicutes-14]|nr:MAG: hypothetical protein CVU89_07645 [Firmicutes bacterium HGW-Firmicutes-14]